MDQKYADTIKRAIEELQSHKAIININIAGFMAKDELAKKIGAGELNVIEFLSRLTGKEPYQLVEIYPGSWLVGSKNYPLHPMMRISPKQLLSFWDNRGLFAETYPELLEEFDKELAETMSASCTSCAKKNKVLKMIERMAALDNTNRDLTGYQQLFGEPFVESLKTFKQKYPHHVAQFKQREEATTIIPPPQPIDIKEIKNIKETPETADYSFRPGCYDCTRKHLGQAIVLLMESLMGYPHHRWLAVAHLAEAAEEILPKSMELAFRIRQERLAIMADPLYKVDLTQLFEEIDKIEAGETQK